MKKVIILGKEKNFIIKFINLVNDETLKIIDSIDEIDSNTYLIFIKNETDKSEKYKKHWDDMKKIMYKYQEQFIQVIYERFFDDSTEEIRRIFELIKVYSPYPLPPQNILNIIKKEMLL